MTISVIRSTLNLAGVVNDGFFYLGYKSKMKNIDVSFVKQFFRLNEKNEIERMNRLSGKWKKVNTNANGKCGYCVIGINNKPFMYQRILWILYYGSDIPNGFLIDHANCNRIDNKIENLRLCTSTQNHRNVSVQTGKTCTLKGVSLQKNRNKKYRATIHENGIRHDLGSFYTEKEAHAAYCEASKKYHGEFGRTE